MGDKHLLTDSLSYSDISDVVETPKRVSCLWFFIPLAVFLVVGILAFILLRLSVFDERRDVVVLISIDGFRQQYLSDERLIPFMPNLVSFAGKSTLNKVLRPSFPSKTFPNHYSIVTGLYPGYHGIVSNHFYDVSKEEEFTMGSLNPMWYGGDPIWNTVQKTNLKSASVFWPGSDVKIGGSHPTYHIPWDGSLPYMERVGTGIAWLNQTYYDIPSFISFYFEGVDSAGHNYGPDNVSEIGNAIKKVDDALEFLFASIEELSDIIDTHIIIVSDHGMTELSNQRLILLEEYIDRDCIHFETFETAIAQLYTKSEECTTQILEKLSGVEHLTPYRRGNTPDRFHYNNSRVGDIFLLADLGWTITRSAPHYTSLGGHGYDNEDTNMQSIFLGLGDRFVDHEEESMENVEIYNIMCKLLGIKTSANNGTYPYLNVVSDHKKVNFDFNFDVSKYFK